MKKAYVFPRPLNCFFAQFIAEQMELFYVYIYVDWYICECGQWECGMR